MSDMSSRVLTGILGGTGLYEIDGITNVREVQRITPFGRPSDAYIIGEIENTTVAFLSRHGRGHRLLPAEVNYRANIFGFKELGVERILSVNSCGSLKEEIHPLDIVLSDQFIDRTHRKNSFFGDGIAAHVAFADPVCPDVAGILYDAARDLGLRIHRGGTYVCIEGPTFSTRAESNLYRRWGCDVVGMTSVTEAKLAREAEICYATMNLVTDYDCWREEEEGVSVEMILENLRRNVDHAKSVLKRAIAALAAERNETCGCGDALRCAIVTNPDLIPEKKKNELWPIIHKYIT
ncbi:MAG: S-methyl-5'-thioadenosine phosphorylase [Acidobacteriota bacterium]